MIAQNRSQNIEGFNRLISENYDSERAYYREFCGKSGWLKRGQFDDVFHDYIIKAVKGIPGFCGQIDGSRRVEDVLGLRVYLDGIFRHTAIDFFRSQKRARSRLDDDVFIEDLDLFIGGKEGDIGEDIENREQLYRVYDDMDSLSPRERQLIELSDLEGLSHSQISQELGISHKTITEGLCNARKKLRELVNPEAINDGNCSRDERIRREVIPLYRRYGLTETQEQVFRPYYLEGKSMGQIALEIGCSERLVLGRLGKARDSLRRKAKKEAMKIAA